MTSTLVTIAQNKETLTWVSVDEQQQIIDGPHTGDLDQLSKQAKQKNITLLIPTSQVSLTHVKAPKTTAAKLRQAVPYAIEEDIASDIEDQQFAIGSWEEAGLAIGVIDRHLLQELINKFKEVELVLDAVLPDVDALPLTANTWSLYLNQDHALLRITDQLGMHIDLANLEAMLRTLRHDDTMSDPEKILVWNPYQYDLQAVKKFNLEVEVEEHTEKRRYRCKGIECS